MDRAIFYSINRLPDSWNSFFLFFSEGNKWLWVRLGLLLLAIALSLRASTRKTVLLALLAFPLANATCDVLKYGFQGIRPCVELPDVILRVDKLTSYGTASAHSASMAAVAFVFIYFHRWWGLPWALVAFLTGLSRVFVGVHYPSQILLGWFVGVFCAFVLIKTLEEFTKLRTRQAEPISQVPEPPAEAS